MSDRVPLQPVVVGVGGPLGYSGSDLTSAAVAAAAGELPHLPLDRDARARPTVVELRIHGVGGAPPETNLEAPSTLQVAGDGAAGFFRAWRPGRDDQADPATWPLTGGVPVRREAYSWGKLNTAGWSRALWLLLIAYATVNLAHWALPATGPRGLNLLSRVVIRLAGLTMTAATTSTAAFVLVDVVARQADRRQQLPSWAGWLATMSPATAQELALVAVVLLVGGLFWLSRRTGRDYEVWPPITDDTEDTGETAALGREEIWAGARTLARQRFAHALVAMATIAATACMFDGLSRTVRVVGIGYAVLLAAVGTVLTCSPWVDRLCRGTEAGPAPRWVTWKWTPGLVLVWALLPVLVVAVLDRGGDVAAPAGALPGDLRLQGVLVLVLLGLVVVLFGLVAVALHGRDPVAMVWGYAAPVVLLFGAMVSTVFAAAVTFAVSNLLGTPVPGGRAATSVEHPIRVPWTTYAGGAAFAAALVAVVAVAAVMWCVRRHWHHRYQRPGEPTGVTAQYRATFGDAVDHTAEPVRRQVAATWATSKLTDCAGGCLAAVSGLTFAVFAAYALGAHGRAIPGAVADLAALGGNAAAAATAAFVLVVRQSVTSSAERKRFGFLWDVVTFWPRAAHPLAPPSYAERSIPELVTRIRRLVGDTERAGKGTDLAVVMQQTERAPRSSPAPFVEEGVSRLLLVGYSQGTPMAVAVVAQLPAAVRDEVALLTLAAPVRRLYGRAFPAWFGPDQLVRLRDSLGGEHASRWRNVVRQSDYIGGWALAERERDGPTSGAVDRWILDPPTLWQAGDPTPPPTHRHSDWFADPQTRACADELVGLLQARPTRPEV